MVVVVGGGVVWGRGTECKCHSRPLFEVRVPEWQGETSHAGLCVHVLEKFHMQESPGLRPEDMLAI